MNSDTSQMILLRINVIERDPVIEFAAEELAKYLKLMSNTHIEVEKNKDCYYTDSNLKEINLGLIASFDEIYDMDVADSRYDDAVYIKIENLGGIIAGTNPRSILISTYRLLYEAGCRWIRPGTDGEFIPKVDLNEIHVKIAEKASYRHRGICIEGAVSKENVIEMIDWAPKVGFNSYYIQFREGYTFYDRWYSHKGNYLKELESFSVEKAKEYVRHAENEIRKRGMVYHAVGHGWTCEPLGIPALGWNKDKYDIEPIIRQYLAEICGKREIRGGIPLNTNLCYSDSRVRELIINNIVEYLEEHEYVDVLHFWLADAQNNHCECGNCIKANPSDFYVLMLNELDELLSKKRIDAKIAFIVYKDTLWPPETEKVINQERFILVFAPINRTYSTSHDSCKIIHKIPVYKRNKLEFSNDLEHSLSFLEAWEKVFNGDALVFEYYYMWDHFFDPGSIKNIRIMRRDIINLKNIGLKGMISCQTQRSFLPTGLGMYLMGQMLWNKKLDYDTLIHDYFISSFGTDGLLCYEYLLRLSEMFDPEYLRGEKLLINKKAVECFDIIPNIIERFIPIIEKNIGNNHKQHMEASWKNMKIHAEMCILFSRFLKAVASGDEDGVVTYWHELSRFLCQKEDMIQSVFDVMEFFYASYTRLLKGYISKIKAISRENDLDLLL